MSSEHFDPDLSAAESFSRDKDYNDRSSLAIEPVVLPHSIPKKLSSMAVRNSSFSSFEHNLDLKAWKANTDVTKNEEAEVEKDLESGISKSFHKPSHEWTPDQNLAQPGVDNSIDFWAIAEYFTTNSTTKTKSILDEKECRFMFYSDATLTLRSRSLNEFPFKKFSLPVLDLIQPNPFWLDVCGATESELRILMKLFHIHPLTIEDIQTNETREKCEIYPNYYFISICTFDNDSFSPYYMNPVNFYIVVFKECVLSFHATFVSHPINILRRIDQLKSYGLALSPDWLNYALIDDITDSFQSPLQHIELEVDTIDELVLILRENEQSDMLRRIGRARKRVMMLLRLLNTKADVIKAVIKRVAERLAPLSETTLYLSDIQDHVITMVQNLGHCDKTLTRSHSNYLAQISIEITKSANKTNDVVMKMTALAGILIPLNIVTGLWGMNVPVPGQDDESLFSFFAIMILMLSIASFTFIMIRRYGFI